MSGHVEAAVIGAGPYGLSVAAHLIGAKVECRVFGVPMESWLMHMPPGMYLKSNSESTNLFDPQGVLSLEHFCRERSLAYHPYKVPVSLKDFIAYGQAFQQRFVPKVERLRLGSLVSTGRAYELNFEDGETVIARHVVLATGVVPFKFVPPEFASLPAALVSHSADYGAFDHLAGKEIVVVGGGASSLDIAALLSMQGNPVTVIARTPELEFQPSPVGDDPSYLQRVVRRIISPSSHGLGDGWVMRICASAPQLIHLLPDRLRFHILSNTLGPSGGYCIRDQVERKVTLKLGRLIERAEEHRGRVRLTLAGPDATRETILSDHVIAATGYKVDLRRLEFLSKGTLAGVRMVSHAPVLSANFESSAPGLYFVGLSAARSFGPVLRFVMGAVHPARRLAQHVPLLLRRRLISLVAPVES
jgi:hypothetical protein